jgi:hypothetical protein
VKVVLLGVTAELWQRSHSICNCAAVVPFATLTLVSVASNVGHQSIHREPLAGDTAAAEKREADLRTELASVGERLKTAG